MNDGVENPTGHDNLQSVDPAVWRRLAEAELALTSTSRAALLEAHQDAFKWLLASLLAINSGGLFAALNAKDLSIAYLSVSGFFFYIGMMFSLLSSYFSQGANRRLIAPLGEAMGYWIAVAHEGEHLPEVWNGIESRIQNAIRKSRVTQVAGWLSAVAFTLGVFSMGYGLLNKSVGRPAPLAVAK